MHIPSSLSSYYFLSIHYRFGIDNKAGKVVSIGGVEKAPLEVLERRAKRFGLCSDEAEVCCLLPALLGCRRVLFYRTLSDFIKFSLLISYGSSHCFRMFIF